MEGRSESIENQRSAHPRYESDLDRGGAAYEKTVSETGACPGSVNAFYRADLYGQPVGEEPYGEQPLSQPAPGWGGGKSGAWF